MSHLPLWPRSPSSHEPFSRQSVEKASRLRGATVTESVCPYCAVGCGQLIYTKGGQLIDIEGNPESPINEGTLCPKGANAFQLAVNPHRVTQRALSRPLLRPLGDAKPLDWAMDRIAAPRQGDARRGLHRAERRRADCSTRCTTSARSAARRWTTRRTT